MASSVKVDLSNLKSLAKKLEDLSKPNVQVGWFESAKYDDGTPVAGIAAQNEFGNPKISIPARPFFRPTVADKKAEWSKRIKDGANAVLAEKVGANAMLAAFGDSVAADVRTTIVTSDYVPLSQITIALRRLRNDGVKIGGATVGAVAAAIARGETGSGQLGSQEYGNKDPLRDTGYMLATLTSEVY